MAEAPPPPPKANEKTWLLARINITDESSSKADADAEKERDLDEQGSEQWRTMGNILNALVGAGVLGLPYTFYRTGWAAGILIIAAVAGLSFYSMMLLIWTAQAQEQDPQLQPQRDDKNPNPNPNPNCDGNGNRNRNRILSYGDLGEAVCGPRGRTLVDAMTVLSQACFCAGYLIYVAATLASFAGHVVPWLAVVPLEVCLNAIPTLTHLAPLSAAADAVTAAALGVVVLLEVAHVRRHGAAADALARPYGGGLASVPYGVGVATYCFEGFATVLPLRAEARPRQRGSREFGGALGTCVGVVAAAYAAFGLAGHVTYGAHVREVVSMNLGGAGSAAVGLALSATLLATFPLMMNPVHDVMERRFNGGRYSLPLRSAAVVVTAVVAFAVPNFADFVSLIGSSVCVVLGFILPAAFHLVVSYRSSSTAAWCSRSWLTLCIMAMDVIIFCFGFVFAVFGTVSVLSQFGDPHSQR